MFPAKKNWRQTSKNGGESRLFKFSLEQTPALQALADVDWSRHLRCKQWQM